MVYGKDDNVVESQITYTYDLSGNQISQSDSVTGEVITNEYDTMNQLTKCVKTTSGVTEYTQVNTYNYDGQRISKTDNGVTTYYYYQGAVLLYTTDANGNKTSQNIVGLQENIIATIRYEEDGQAAYFYNKDIRTSVTNVVDDIGLGVVSYQYDDYGTTTKYGSQEFYNEICYTSGVYDELTSLYYLNARYYNPSTAMFMTQDSYRGEKNDYGTWNLYAYCGGNPINYVDPSGHAIETIFDIGSIAYSGVSLIANPSWANLGYLAWDIGATVVPFVPGSYTAKAVKAIPKVKKVKSVTRVAKGAKTTIQVADRASDFSKASRALTVGKYSVLRKALKGNKKIEVHHIIEQRLKKGFKKGINSSNMLCIPLEKKFHRTITNRWRKTIPYGKSVKKISKKQMLSYCEEVYHDMPQLKDIAMNYVRKYWR